jgi:hypothetical protein
VFGIWQPQAAGHIASFFDPWMMDPVSGMGKNWIRDEHPRSFFLEPRKKQFFGVKKY